MLSARNLQDSGHETKSELLFFCCNECNEVDDGAFKAWILGNIRVGNEMYDAQKQSRINYLVILCVHIYCSRHLIFTLSQF
jgi:endogenous inhibitor of DNA gyrase (YacG/DUF329 family)